MEVSEKGDFISWKREEEEQTVRRKPVLLLLPLMMKLGIHQIKCFLAALSQREEVAQSRKKKKKV